MAHDNFLATASIDDLKRWGLAKLIMLMLVGAAGLVLYLFLSSLTAGWIAGIVAVGVVVVAGRRQGSRVASALYRVLEWNDRRRAAR